MLHAFLHTVFAALFEGVLLSPRRQAAAAGYDTR